MNFTLGVESSSGLRPGSGLRLEIAFGHDSPIHSPEPGLCCYPEVSLKKARIDEEMGDASWPL